MADFRKKAGHIQEHGIPYSTRKEVCGQNKNTVTRGCQKLYKLPMIKLPMTKAGKFWQTK